MAVDATTLEVPTVGWVSDGFDALGCAWTLTGLTGWWEPPGVKDTSQQRPIGPGAFEGDVYDDVRVIGVTERVSAPDPPTLHAALDLFGRVRGALMAGTTIIGHQPNGDYTVTGKAGQNWQTNPVGGLGFEYQFSVSCRDPYKYGATVTKTTGLPTPGGSLTWPLWYPAPTGGALNWGVAGNSGRVTVLNPGSAPAWPVFTATGPLIGGFSVSDLTTGSLVTFADDVPALATVVIYSDTARAVLNGSDWSGSLTYSQFWSVPPQGSSTVQFAALASGQTGTLAVSLAPAYY